MKNKEYIILHGLNGSPENHWQWFLYKDLKILGEKVYFPQFPNNEKPDLDKWIHYLSKFKNHIHKNTVIIAHSMGVILWLHYLEKNTEIKVNKTILVAPPSAVFLDSNDFTKTFSSFHLNKGLVKNSTKKALLIASQNDKFCLPSAKEIFLEKLNIDYMELPPKAGHININSGYGYWKEILPLILNS